MKYIQVSLFSKKQKLKNKNKNMTEEIKAATQGDSCECENGSCTHQEAPQESVMSHLTKHRGSEEIAFAFLLALTPLAVLTFFGQAGLL